MTSLLLAALTIGGTCLAFNPLHHLGGNSPYFPGSDIHDIDPAPPSGCKVDQVAFTSRHGSRYPDPSAYYQWTNLSAKIHASTFSTSASELQFLHSWTPVLRHPELELSELSIGGYQELYSMGVQYRYTYPDLYTENERFVLWANLYQPNVYRVVDSARLFARGYLGPNSTDVGEVYVINSTDPRSIANSLAPSDLCPKYNDTSGGENATTWAAAYLPPIVDRINGLLEGLNFSTSDVTIFPYLCGFESQITGKRSPWCDVFTEEEILQYEYAQDIRYWYGTGLGTDLEKNMMLPFLTAVIQRLVDGPNATYSDSISFNPLIATFTNDGQVNQLVAATGIFDDEPQLSATEIPDNRSFRSSNFVSMRGTVTFERLNCESGVFVRLKLNNAVYPVASCQDGPGRSCGLQDYQDLIAKKSAAFGDFETACGVANISVMPVGEERTTFLTDLGLPFEVMVRP